MRPFEGQTEYRDKYSVTSSQSRGRGHGDKGRSASSVRPCRIIRDNVQDAGEQRSVSTYTHNDTADATAGTGLSTAMTQDSLTRDRAQGHESNVSAVSSATGAARFAGRPESSHLASNRVLGESLSHSRRGLVRVPVPRPAQPSSEANSSYKWPKTRQTHIATIVRRGRAPGTANRDRGKENVPASNRVVSAPQGLKVMAGTARRAANSFQDDFSQ